MTVIAVVLMDEFGEVAGRGRVTCARHGALQEDGW
jgi:hypothetical protein